MSQNTRLLITLPNDIKEKLQEIAKQETRSVSNLIRKIIIDYLKDKN